MDEEGVLSKKIAYLISFWLTIYSNLGMGVDEKGKNNVLYISYILAVLWVYVILQMITTNLQYYYKI